jgi:hypothetical protein
VQIDEGRIQAHLDEVVRSTVEEALNALLDAEADHLCGARKYERTEGRKDTRAGSYDWHLQTKAGEVTLAGARRIVSGIEGVRGKLKLARHILDIPRVENARREEPPRHFRAARAQ